MSSKVACGCGEKGKDEGRAVKQALWLLPWPETPELDTVMWASEDQYGEHLCPSPY